MASEQASSTINPSPSPIKFCLRVIESLLMNILVNLECIRKKKKHKTKQNCNPDEVPLSIRCINHFNKYIYDITKFLIVHQKISEMESRYIF